MAAKFDYHKVIGHRGACAYAPENTLASLRAAHRLGVKWVELDVQVTTCGTPVVFHDESLSRTTNGTGRLVDQTYQAISTLDAGLPFAPQYAGERIPTLKNYLLAARELGVSLHVEIKSFADTDVERWVTAVLKVLAEHGEHPLIISSFSEPVLRAVRLQDANIPVSFTMAGWRNDWVKLHEFIDFVGVHADFHSLTQQRLDALREAKLQVLSYTVNDARIAKQLFDWGIDAVFSDAPDRILRNHSHG